MNEQPDALARLLAEDAATPIADDGFARGVLAALPPPVPRWQAKLVIGSAVAGCALAAALAPGGVPVVEGVLDLMRANLLSPGALLLFAYAFALTATGAILVAQD
jgi:hypothetical protein